MQEVFLLGNWLMKRKFGVGKMIRRFCYANLLDVRQFIMGEVFLLEDLALSLINASFSFIIGFVNLYI